MNELVYFARVSEQQIHPVLGPNLGGGIVGSGIGSGVGRVGGGLDPPVLYAYQPESWPQVRQDFADDHSTPRLEGRLAGGVPAGLTRGFGGLL